MTGTWPLTNGAWQSEMCRMGMFATAWVSEVAGWRDQWLSEKGKRKRYKKLGGE